jgi:hypothetical protein
MKHETIYFNPTPIFVYQSDTPIFNQEEINSLINLEFLPAKRENGVRLTKNNYIFEDIFYKNIKNTYLKAVDYFTQNILCTSNKFKLTQSWLTKNEPNAFHPWHEHPNVMISAVAYFSNSPLETNFAPIVFAGKGLKNVFKHFQFKLNETKWNEFNSLSWTIYPKINQIIIFPGHLEHKSVENDNVNDRYCLGANFFLNDIVGRKDDVNELNVKILNSTSTEKTPIKLVNKPN